jgi:OOP family OmpA-OmpF porin
MRLSDYLPISIAVIFGALACLGVATAAVTELEKRSEGGVRSALADAGQSWAEVAVDGLRVTLTGTAPDEASRFDAISAAGTVVDSARVIDEMSVRASSGGTRPDFTVEILRNADGISLIGLVPDTTDREALSNSIRRISNGTSVTDLLESADYRASERWEPALDFALAALSELPQSKVSVRVAITAFAPSDEVKRRLERDLPRRVPEGVALVLDISAPRPVITPFTVRFTLDADGARFDACASETVEAQTAILNAARGLGAEDPSCRIGIGRPSRDWGRAVVRGLEAISELGGGTITFSDADVTVVGLPGTAPRLFERTMAELDADLPPLFSLATVLPEPEEDSERDATDAGPAEFTATRSPEGLAHLRGRLPDARTRAAVRAFAEARFGQRDTDLAASISPDTPEGWPIRVLAALDALSLLSHGSATVLEDSVEIRGATGDRETEGEIVRRLTSTLGDEGDYRIEVTYLEELDPVAALPTPEECLDRLNAALATRKITFEPGSANIDADALATIDLLADVLRDCQTVRLEIAGHTDSQGRESMNLNLSQARADSVLNAIMARRVLTTNIVAKGYGETDPVADNGTEEGREENRRIEFRLLDAAAENARAAEAEAGTAEEQDNEQN